MNAILNLILPLIFLAQPPISPKPQIINVDSVLMAADTNKDAQVSLTEWKSAKLDLVTFSLIDGNGDGFITPFEYNEWKKGNTVFSKEDKSKKQMPKTRGANDKREIRPFFVRELLPMPNKYVGPTWRTE